MTKHSKNKLSNLTHKTKGILKQLRSTSSDQPTSPRLSFKVPSLSAEETDSSTFPSSEIFPSVFWRKQLVVLVKQVVNQLRYGVDTQMVALMLLKRVEWMEQGREKLLAAVLVVIAAKVHQFRTPQFNSLALWSGYQFGRDELVAAEGAMLLQMGFRVPAVLGCGTQAEARKAVKRLEDELGGDKYALPFQ